MPQVVFHPPGEMNLLGYILRSLLDRNLKSPGGERAFRKMKGKVLVGASQMKVTLDFDGDDLQISVGLVGKAQARVQGSMDTLLGVALGKGMVGPVLSGKLKVGGRVWRLLRMLKLLEAES
jgi:hypothetical protein